MLFGPDAHGGDLPPRPECASAWRTQPEVRLMWEGQQPAPRTLVLPHPSWRNSGWLKRNPWFEAELLPCCGTRWPPSGPSP